MKKKKFVRCPKRAAWNKRFRCVLAKGHSMKDGHWGPWGAWGDGKVRVGFCHGVGEKCHHLL